MNNLPAGELKRPARTYLRATFVCLGVVCATLLVTWLAIKQMTGLNFIQAASALSQDNPVAWAHATGGAPFTPNYYVEILGSPAIRIAIAAAFTIGAMINPIAVSFVSSRVMFALSFDRLLPTRLADVRERSHMPVNAALLTSVIVLLFGALIIFSTGFDRLVRNSLLMSIFVLLVGSLSCAALPFRRPDLFESSPRVLKGRIGPVPLTTIVACLAIAILVWLFYIAATNTALSGGYDTGSVTTLVGVGLAGVLAYAISRIYPCTASSSLRCPAPTRSPPRFDCHQAPTPSAQRRTPHRSGESIRRCPLGLRAPVRGRGRVV